MKTFVLALLLLLAASGCARPDRIRWANGRWFDGRGFSQRTLYSDGAVLTEKEPPWVGSTVDLRGRYVVPPFGDAHHHGIDSAPGLDAKIASFLRGGIFYVKNPNVIPDLLTAEVRGKLDRPDSIDVSFSNGGLTSTGGHPAPLHAELAKRGVFPGLGPADMENRAYFLVDDEPSLAAKWPRILAGRPDFIKTFLLFSGQTAPEGTPPDFAKGLSPEVLRAVVVRAHAAGLRVTSHIETALDFRVAVDAGVDEITHLPQFAVPLCKSQPALCEIDAATAARCAERGIVVVAAPLGWRWDPIPAEKLEALKQHQRSTLQRLMAAGVRIALGSDGISGETPFPTAVGDALWIHDNGYMSDLALLRAWTENTARTIFPSRKIGELRDGYEASFLVLEGNPLEDFKNVTRIAMRVKQGRTMAPARVE